MLKNIKKALKIAKSKPFIKNVGKVFAAIGYFALSSVGTISLAAAVGGFVWSESYRKDIYSRIKNSEDYKIYRIAEDERLQNYYSQTVAEDLKKFENGEISKDDLEISKNKYENEVAESNNLDCYLESTNNTDYDGELFGHATIFFISTELAILSVTIGILRVIDYTSNSGLTMASEHRFYARECITSIFKESNEEEDQENVL